MNYLRLTIVSLLLTILFCANVHADKLPNNFGWYGKLGLGVVSQVDNYNETNLGVTHWQYDQGGNAALSSGYEWKYGGIEGEISYRKMDASKRILISSGNKEDINGNQTQIALMVNGILNLVPTLENSPYIGLGIGMTRVSWNHITSERFSGEINDSDNVFTYQILLGASYAVTSSLLIEIDYRYIVPDDVLLTTSLGSTGKLESQELNVYQLAIKYGF